MKSGQTTTTTCIYWEDLRHNVPISKAEYTAYKGMVDLQILYIPYAFVIATLM